MASAQSTSSISMPRALERRLRSVTPMYGDRSRLICRLVEMWLDGKIHVDNLKLRSQNARNINIVAKSRMTDEVVLRTP